MPLACLRSLDSDRFPGSVLNGTYLREELLDSCSVGCPLRFVFCAATLGSLKPHSVGTPRPYEALSYRGSLHLSKSVEV